MMEWEDEEEKSTFPVKISPIDGHLTNRRKHKICEVLNTHSPSLSATHTHTQKEVLWARGHKNRVPNPLLLNQKR